MMETNYKYKPVAYENTKSRVIVYFLDKKHNHMTSIWIDKEQFMQFECMYPNLMHVSGVTMAKIQFLKH